MAVWQGFVAALNAGNQNAALNMISPDARPVYQEAFATLGSQVTQLSRNWSAPEPVSSTSEYVTVLITAQEPAGSRGHLVTLVRDNEQWFVDRF